MRFVRLFATFLPLLFAACSPADGIAPSPGSPSCRLVFAEGVLRPAIPGTQPVQPLKINQRSPSLLRFDHNQFDVPAGPLSVIVQGFASGFSASAAVQFDAQPGETYLFGHQPASGRETTFTVVDSRNRVIGTSRKTLQPTPSQAPIYLQTD